MLENPKITLDPVRSAAYSRNLDLFREREPRQADRIHSSIGLLSAYEFVQVGAGQYICSHRDEGISFYDPQQFLPHLNSSQKRMMQLFQNGKDLLVIAGSALGYLAAMAENAIRDDYNKGLLLYENRPELMAAQFCLFDCKRLIESRQIFWAVGDSIVDVMEDVFSRHRLDLIPASKIYPVQEREMNASEKAVIHQFGGWVSKKWQITQSKLVGARERYTAAVSRPANLENGTVWAMTAPDAYAHAPLLRNMMNGFSELGWTSSLIEIQDGFGGNNRISESLIETSPDLLLLCNTASSAFFSTSIDRPCINWFLDHPRYYAGKAFKQELCGRDHVFYIDREYGHEMQDTRAGHHQFLPAAASISRKGEYREDFAAPVLFVGVYQDATKFYRTLPKPRLDELYAVLDCLIQHPKRKGSGILDSMKVSGELWDIVEKNAEKFAQSFSDRFPDKLRQIDYFLYSLANSRKRERAVRQLLDLGLVIYGPESWGAVLGEKYASQYRGWIASDDLADAYASADVVLNVHSLQCPTCLNPRDFDVLAAGGCLVTDWVEDIDNGIVEPDKDCSVVRTAEDYVREVKRLLDDAGARNALSGQGHDTYLSNHTPKHRAREMISVIQSKRAV